MVRPDILLLGNLIKMINLYDKKGNVILASLCDDIENTKDYKIVELNKVVLNIFFDASSISA